MATARKGDLALIERQAVTYSTTEGRQVRTEYVFAVVASATREGVVKTYTQAGSDCAQSMGRFYVERCFVERCFVMPAADIDVAAVIEAAKAHHWPGHPGQPMAFESIEVAREIARPFKK